MKTRAAVVRGPGEPWELTELDLDEPKEHEVLVRVMVCGLCHSDEHVREGGPYRYPMVGGHEGAGIVEKVGPNVTRVREGEHICTSWIPVCGHCRYCSTGRQNMCNDGLNAGTGMMLDGTFRFHENGSDIGGMCVLGTFSQWIVISENACVPIDEDIPFEVAALVACGVTTGWGSSVYAAGTRAGETVVIYGTGGVGMNAVQGAAYAGAKHVIAVDPNPYKQEMAGKFGATFTTGDAAEAEEYVRDATRGEMADHAVITIGVMDAEVLRSAVDAIGKGGSVVVTAVGGGPDNHTIAINGSPVTGWHKNIQGSLFGGANPLYDMPRLLGLWRAGQLKLEELITNRYRLEDINQGYKDMLEGRNIRGVLIHEHRRRNDMTAIMDPTGRTQGEASAGLALAPRRAELSGATVGLLENGKQNARLFLEEVAGVLRERYGVGEVTLRRKEVFSAPAPPELVDEMSAAIRRGGHRRRRLRLVQRLGDRRRRPVRAPRHPGGGHLLRRVRGHRRRDGGGAGGAGLPLRHHARTPSPD